MVDHFKASHSSCPISIESRFNIDVYIADCWLYSDKSFCTHKQINLFNATFYTVSVASESQVAIWVYILGDREEAKKYFYHISIKNGITGQEISGFEQVCSIDEEKDDIIKNDKAFVNKTSKIRKFTIECEKQRKSYATFNVEIRNMKEEAKDSDEESGISD